jgi:hypothetical protein
MTDIAAIQPQERTIEIMHPVTELPLGLRVTMIGVDDPRLSTMRRSITDNQLRAQAKGKAPKFEEMNDDMVNMLSRAVIKFEWYNPTGAPGDDGYDADALPSYNGEQPDCNPKNVRGMLEMLPWFKDQVREAFDEKKAFFNNSKSN